jgi:hypothetical protein
MSRLVKKWIPIFIATIVGLIVLLCYLFPNQLMVKYQDHRVELRVVLVEWAVVIAAFALLFGIFNIARVHSTQVLRQRSGRYYSLALMLAMAAAMIPPILPSGLPLQKTLDHFTFDYIISPLGASLAALVAFTLALAAFRLLRARRGAGTILFLLIVIVVLLGNTPFVGMEQLADIRDWIVNVPGMAGMRGLLLGVALGTVITALRVLLAVERPYSES